MFSKLIRRVPNDVLEKPARKVGHNFQKLDRANQLIPVGVDTCDYSSEVDEDVPVLVDPRL